MAKKINELSELFVNSEEELDKYYAEISAANVALENECYKQAWDHYYEVCKTKDPLANKNKNLKGEAAYGLCRVMQEISNNDEFVQYLIDTDTDLIRRKKVKTVTPGFARKYIGRKYLVLAADDYGYMPAIEEYALNCVGKGHSKSFVFEYNDKDAQVGLQWANKLIASNENRYKTSGYIVYAIYHFARYRTLKTEEEGIQFCENVMKALNNAGNDEQYSKYFYAHMCCDPKFNFYEQGRHYNPKEGYLLFKEVAQYATDPDIKASAKNIKETLEKKYPSMIR